MKIKTKNAPQGVQNSNFAQHQKTGGANQDKPDHADEIHHGKIPGGRGLCCSGGRGLRCGAALGRDNLHLGGGLVHLDGGRCFLGAGGRAGRGRGGLRGGGGGIQSAAGSVMTAIKKAAQKKRFIEKTPPQFQSLACIGNDAATCHRDLYFLYCSTAGALRQDAAKKS